MVSIFAGEIWNMPATPSTWAAFTYLVVVGSVFLFYLYLYVLTRWTASATSYAFLLFPVATTIIYAWLTDEAIRLRFVAGGLLVLFGVWVGAIRQMRRPPELPDPAKSIDIDLTAPPRPGCA